MIRKSARTVTQSQSGRRHAQPPAMNRLRSPAAHRGRRGHDGRGSGHLAGWLLTLAILCLAGCAGTEPHPAPAGRTAGLRGEPAMPWRGIHMGVNGESIERLIVAAAQVLPQLGINVLVVEVDYSFEFQSHPELRNANPISRQQAQRLVQVCRQNGIRVIPQFQSLGHQSWARRTHPLLTEYPEFDETPQIPLDNPGIYCRSWCPLNDDVYEVVFELIDELIEAFEPGAFHVGMDEVQLLAHEQCRRCRGKDPARLLAKAVRDMHAHITGRRGLDMLMWGDMLIDPEKIPFVAGPRTHLAVDMIPKDIIVCDWQYGRQHRYPSIDYFLDRGLRVWPSGWNSPEASRALALAAQQSAAEGMLGHLFTVWGGAGNLPDILMEGLDHELARGNIRGVAQSILEVASAVQAVPQSTLRVPVGTAPSDRGVPISVALGRQGNYGVAVVEAAAQVMLVNASWMGASASYRTQDSGSDAVGGGQAVTEHGGRDAAILGEASIDYSGDAVLLGQVSTQDPASAEFAPMLEPGKYRVALRGLATLADGREDRFEILSAAFGVASPLNHAARDAAVWVSFPPSPKYPASGPATLTDGIVGDTSWEAGSWLSFLSDDLDATLDLGVATSVRHLQAYFLQNQGPYVFMPVVVRFSLSADGVHFREVASAVPVTSPRHNGAVIEAIDVEIDPREARYVRVQAASVGVCPQWHPGRGEKAWLMAGEILVNPVGE
jgi:hypothetical protein